MTPNERAARIVRDTQTHPLARRRWRWWVISILLLLLALAQLAAGNVAFGVLLGGVGGWLARAAWRIPRIGRVVQAFNVAANLTLAGQFDDAWALLDAIEPQAKGRYLTRLVAAQRAQIALYRGQLDVAEREATRAAEGRTGLGSGANERPFIAMALSVRALARALAGSAEGALADAAAAEQREEASSMVLGRALLARLAVASRAGDLPRMRELCRTAAGMPAIADLLPRERELYRNYRKLAFSPSEGAYREAQNPEAAPEADFFRARADAAAAALPAPAASSPEAVQRLVAQRAQAGKRYGRKLLAAGVGLWAALMALFFALWQILEPAPTPPGDAPLPAVGTSYAMIYLMLAFLVGVVAYRLHTIRTRLRVLTQARKRWALGDDAGARLLLAHKSLRRVPTYRASAAVMRAQLDYADAAFDAALIQIDEATQALTNAATRAANADVLVPLVSEERAVILAALGRTADARAEHALLAQTSPTYSLRVRADHRIGLLCAVAERNWEAARELAKHRPADAPIAHREELLGDLVRMAEATSFAERKRVAEELEEAPALRRWLDAVAPGLAGQVLEPAEADDEADAAHRHRA